MKGPIAVFGSGGFIGSHLVNELMKKRSDIIAFSHNPEKAWRLKKFNILPRSIKKCDLTNNRQVSALVKKYKPQTIFNLAAYGAYSWEKDVFKIYDVNFTSTVNLIGVLKKYGFSMYIHAGSQSEYGLNAACPAEDGKLIPNSHYAVSKAAVSQLLTYYGRIEKLPVVHLRLYSVYGPLEEKGRLVETTIRFAKRNRLPTFADPKVSRDFIYVDDVVSAFIICAVKAKKNNYGEAFNVATGKKTTIREFAMIIKKMYDIKSRPIFKPSQRRKWDVINWYGNPEKIKKTFGWQAKIDLKTGLKKTMEFTF